MSKQKEHIPKGNKFLPNTTHASLKSAYSKETDLRSRDRLLAYMQRKDGLQLDVIAKNLQRSKSTISEWLNRAQDEGIRARYERIGRGRKKMLTKPQLKKLVLDLDAGPQACGFESSLWDSNLVRLHIKKKFGVQYSKNGALQIIHGLGFSWKKSRPKNPKSASKKEQEEFKKSSRKLITEKKSQGYTIMSDDEASVQKSSNRPGYGWKRRGRRNTSPSILSHKKKYIFGVLTAGVFYFLFYEKANSDSFIDFLQHVHKKFGRVLIFVDNASYHKSKKVKEFLEECNGEIILEYLLPYTPELNPVEIQWRMIKRAISARVFSTFDEMEQSVRRLFTRREVLPVKVFDYLMG